MLKANFGGFIKARRKKLGLTQRDVAAATNNTSQYISDVENNRRPAMKKKQQISALAKLLKIDVFNLLILSWISRNNISWTDLEELVLDDTASEFQTLRAFVVAANDRVKEIIAGQDES